VTSEKIDIQCCNRLTQLGYDFAVLIKEVMGTKKGRSSRPLPRHNIKIGILTN
jgi:hypothetical protein